MSEGGRLVVRGASEYRHRVAPPGGAGIDAPPGERGPADVVATEIVAPSALTTVLDACREAVALTDLEGRVVHANRAARDLCGEAVAPGACMLAPGAWEDWSAGAETFERALRDLYDDPRRRGGGELTRGGTACRVYGWTSDPVHGACGTIVGRSFLLRDRSEERELAALKSDFLSTVTHELRTPLTSVKGSLQLVLGKSPALGAIDRELLSISLKNTDRLIRMINDLLDISRLELGKLDLTFTTVAAGPLVEEAVAGLRAYAGGRDITVACELDPALPAIRGDRDRLIQVLTNLLSNAIKFSPAGGSVVVRAGRTAGGVAIAVRDWGVGIRASDQGRLFQRFQRLQAASSGEPGTGLGLAISKAIVDRHGGRISVESLEDEGSTFTIVLPTAHARASETAPGDDAPEERAGTRRPTLLLVDDDADLGTVLEASLGATYRVRRVERGVQALDAARAEHPDLVLLDVVLPDLSGYDVLRILRHSAATCGIPVVMLTVQPERELAASLGAAAVVAKPVDIDELRRALERTLRRRLAGPELHASAVAADAAPPSPGEAH
jgi:signal transduction histidine kinase/ActR/RegA family two-component response regulator